MHHKSIFKSLLRIILAVLISLFIVSAFTPTQVHADNFDFDEGDPSVAGRDWD